MQLNYKKLGQSANEKQSPIIILHGLLGMLDNWLSIGKALSGNYEVFLADARNHGRSPHSDIFNYDAMAEDVLELMEDNFIQQASIIGHSMGGKTAMKFAQKFPEKIEKLIVADISPKQYPFLQENIFKALLAVDFSLVKSRKEAEEIFEKYIPENFIRQFLLKNLYWKETNQLAWKFNLETIYKNIENIGEAAMDTIFDKPTLFLRGENSGYILKEDSMVIKKYFPKSEIKTIPGAGHWIHAEQPQLFIDAVTEFLN